MRTTDSADDDYEDDDYSVENMLDHHHHHMHRNEGNLINDELKYGAGHQSIDSNPVESQSEWSDDECREEAMGKKLIHLGVLKRSYRFEFRWCRKYRLHY